MGSIRLVESCDEGMPVEVDVNRLTELLPDRRNQLCLDISDPGPAGQLGIWVRGRGRVPAVHGSMGFITHGSCGGSEGSPTRARRAG